MLVYCTINDFKQIRKFANSKSKQFLSRNFLVFPTVIGEGLEKSGKENCVEIFTRITAIEIIKRRANLFIALNHIIVYNCFWERFAK